MERILNTMQDQDKYSDPRATTVHITGDTTALPSIPGYRVVKKLGQGGMATVFLARQESLDRDVSIKVMERESLVDDASMQRFENETRTIAKLSHPNIVAIYEVGRTADGRMYYTMPFLPNGDLAQRDLGTDETRVVELLRPLLSALDYAHNRGIVHRDVKQENVLFDGDNRPLLADFGIAMSKTDDVRITTAGLAVGSSGYMAPEQARGDVVDGRADLYSVGVLAYELLTGALPFRSNDALALALMHAQKDIPRLPPAKRHWQPFIDRAMAKSPDQRFANAKQMLESLDRISQRSGNHISQRVLRTIDRTTDNGLKKPLLIALAVVLLAGVVYAERDHLPGFGSSTDSTVATSATPASASQATTAPVSSATNPLPAIASGKTASPASVQPPAPPPPVAAPPQAPIAATPQAPIAAPPPTPSAGPPQAPITEAPTQTAAGVALGNARSSLERGYLIAPAGKNAVDLSLAAWELAPGTPDSRKLVDDVLKAVSAQESMAITQKNDSRATELEKKAEMLDNATVGPSASAWKSLHAAVNNALLARAGRESSDPAAQARTQSLGSQLGVQLASTVKSSVASSPIAPPHVASGVSSGPPNVAAATGTTDEIANGFVRLHGQLGIFPPAAISRTEVTKREFMEFQKDTHRPAADCNGPKAERVAADNFAQVGRGARFGRNNWTRSPAPPPASDSSAAPKKSWTKPGFEQTWTHPVVCVSWNDATAYAAWLGQRDGRHYRLPSSKEWQMVVAAGVNRMEPGAGTLPATAGAANSLGLYGLDGNVAEWLQECAFGCERHMVAGRSWKDRGTDQVPSGRMADRGFDDVGFRLVQVLGSH